MSTVVRYELIERIALITIDNPPVNALSPAVWEAIDAAVARAAADPNADAAVLIGAGTTFIAGDDIKAFDTLTTREASMARLEKTHALLRRLEDCRKPIVAAIHGNALGGGNEVAMACHYRVASADARLGQPEVLLGIFPGAGGTQRLPRLTGPALALRMCTDGKPISAKEAHAAGLVDVVIAGNLRFHAIALAQSRAAAGETRKTRSLDDEIADAAAGLAACEQTRAGLANTAHGMRAPYAAVEAIESALRESFEAGSIRERELFAKCVGASESKALRHLFFAEREIAKIPDVPKDTPTRTICRAAVVGAGTMGGGIAMTYAKAGISVLLKEVDQVALDRGVATIRKSYESTVAKGKMSREAYERAMSLITPTTSYDGFADVDIVVEAVFENMDLKKAMFAPSSA